ncbi:hypothetical protein [Pseudarthrobacter sp. PH31-O2]|uniref:hypothetical protein n=1 Tax=Pseudarthrobacter sp. PH31-O2 TaxID=3046206 RepID=UPI0024BA4F28|nr:hypothetical protein [Pseudarthrobacter sp. PH31-O2]MDJ0354401.1 hypothetical protein [Pseudarthrobacter sp. PH31-O2]
MTKEDVSLSDKMQQDVSGRSAKPKDGAGSLPEGPKAVHQQAKTTGGTPTGQPGNLPRPMAERCGLIKV